MAEYKGEYGHPYPRVDEYGNPVPPVDQYGNPIPREPASVAVGTGVSPADCGTGFYGVAPGDYGTVDTTFPPEDVVTGGVATGAQFQPTREEHTVGAALQSSGSVSSSSSSEDDGQGGRRKKKSIKEKIKDKLPGTHKHEEQKVRHGQAQAGTPEKKGVIEKIKEKLLAITTELAAERGASVL